MSDTRDSIHVLHIDDEPEFADVAATFLEREDERFSVETATGADEGLDRLEEGDFECIVSDYDMPGQSGIEFLETVREQYPDLPFILFTGKGSEEVASDAISAGVTDYLQKESGTDQYAILANRVVNAVERYRIEREAEHTRRQLQAIAENSADAIVIIDTDSRIRFANPAIEDLLGYTPSELRGDRLTTIMPERHRQTHLDAIDRYLETDERSLNWSNVEFPGQHRDGTERLLSISFSEFDQDGEHRFLGIIRDISDRTRMEEELREREQRYRTLAENFPNGAVLVFDSNLRFRYAHGDIFSTIDSDPSTYEGKQISEVFEGETLDIKREMYEATLNGETREREMEYAGRIYQVYTIPIRDESGDVYAGIAMTWDITERKEREGELRSLTEEYETIFENAEDAIFLIDVENAESKPEFRFERLNPSHEATSGLVTEEIRGKTPREVLGDDFGAEVEANYRRCVEAREPVTYNEKLPMPEGRIVWQTNLVPVIVDGEVTQIVGIAREVTDRVEREQELERYETTVEKFPDSVYIYDANLECIFVNQAAVDTTGTPREEFLGESVETLLEPLSDDQYQASIEAMNQLAAGEREQTRTTLRFETDTGEVYVDTRTSRIESDGGEFLGIASVLRDVTERVEAQQELRRQNERLAEFTSVVSHDLRNPLNVAGGRVELARAECDSDHLDDAANALDRMEALIDDLLTLAREGETATTISSVNLAELTENCWRTVETKNAALVSEVERTIRADEGRLRQLFENLIRNAVEHGSTASDASRHDAVEHGGDDVTVTVGGLEGGFYIEDDGPGIPEDDRDAVFESGYSTSERGTGFGLSIVEQIVEAHGWDILVTESEDGGARFEITGVEAAG